MERYIFDVPVKANIRIEVLANNFEEAIEELYDYEKQNEMEDEDLVDFEYHMHANELWDVKEDLK